jgi:putative phosphoribosyl transferase
MMNGGSTMWTPGSVEPPLFRDRESAARELARHLAAYRGRHPLVLGIPRGGVPIAAVVADELGGELDVIVARKLGAPLQPELAFGAITADGHRWLNHDILPLLQLTPEDVEAVAERALAEARRREASFRAGRPPLRVEDRIVIVCDDGLATGATMRAAVQGLRARGASRVVAAAPVGSREACAALADLADEVVCPSRPEPFNAVGHFYQDFAQLSDWDVIRLLRPEAARQ